MTKQIERRKKKEKRGNLLCVKNGINLMGNRNKEPFFDYNLVF